MQIWILTIQLSPLLFLSTHDFTPTGLLMFLALYPQSNVNPGPCSATWSEWHFLQISVCWDGLETLCPSFYVSIASSCLLHLHLHELETFRMGLDVGNSTVVDIYAYSTNLLFTPILCSGLGFSWPTFTDMCVLSELLLWLDVGRIALLAPLTRTW